MRIIHKIFSILLTGWIVFTADATWADRSYPMPEPAPAEVLARGKRVYNYVCAPCHGKDGKGRGPVSATIRVKPRDFTAGIYKYRTTQSGQLPTIEDIYRSVVLGFHATAMPSFGQLSPEDIYAVVRYIMTFSPRFSDPNEYPLQVIEPSPPVPLTPESMARGRKIYLKMQCWQCHGLAGKGDGPASKTLRDQWGHPMHMPDLTNPQTVKRARSREDIYLIFTTGLNGTPMPSYKSVLSDEDRWHLTNYIWGLLNGYASYDGKTLKDLQTVSTSGNATSQQP